MNYGNLDKHWNNVGQVVGACQEQEEPIPSTLRCPDSQENLEERERQAMLDRIIAALA